MGTQGGHCGASGMLHTSSLDAVGAAREDTEPEIGIADETAIVPRSVGQDRAGLRRTSASEVLAGAEMK